jgi:predicted hotdog family 3-hydroxylacyl-ACP dehydratase
MSDAAGLLPHQRTARLLTQVLRHDGESIEAVGVISPSHPLAMQNGAPNFLALELGAQAAAALEALSRQDGHGGGEPRVGYLVRVRDAAFTSAVLPVGVPLSVTAVLEGTAPPLAMYRVTVTDGDEPLATALLSTYSEGS